MKIPETDSIRELAEFWDTHDVTEFTEELVEVAEPVFAGRPTKGVTVPLSTSELKALRDHAASRGVDEAVLIRTWVQEKLHH
jgi:predicted DNA binding CopG/RHH family protein